MGFAWTDLKLINASRVQAHGLQESEHAMDTILTASFGTHLPVAVILLRLAMASILGLVIGIEREARDRPAGLRTHMLTALAAAVFSLIAIEMMESFGADDRRPQLIPYVSWRQSRPVLPSSPQVPSFRPEDPSKA